MAQLIKTVSFNPVDKTELELVYANHTEPDTLLKTELDELQSKFPERFKVRYIVGDDSMGDDTPRRITKTVLQQVLPDPDSQQDKPVKVMV